MVSRRRTRGRGLWLTQLLELEQPSGRQQEGNAACRDESTRRDEFGSPAIRAAAGAWSCGPDLARRWLSSRRFDIFQPAVTETWSEPGESNPATAAWKASCPHGRLAEMKKPPRLAPGRLVLGAPTPHGREYAQKNPRTQYDSRFQLAEEKAMRDRTLIRTLQLQAEDGSFVDVQEWAKTPQTHNNGRLVVLPGDISYVASPGGHVEKVGPGEYVISATGARLIDTTDEE